MMIGDLVKLKSGIENRGHTRHIGVIISIEQYDLPGLNENTHLIWERDSRDIFKIWFGDIERFLYLCDEDFEII